MVDNLSVPRVITVKEACDKLGISYSQYMFDQLLADYGLQINENQHIKPKNMRIHISKSLKDVISTYSRYTRYHSLYKDGEMLFGTPMITDLTLDELTWHLEIL